MVRDRRTVGQIKVVSIYSVFFFISYRTPKKSVPILKPSPRDRELFRCVHCGTTEWHILQQCVIFCSKKQDTSDMFGLATVMSDINVWCSELISNHKLGRIMISFVEYRLYIMTARHNKGTWLTHAHRCVRAFTLSLSLSHTHVCVCACVLLRVYFCTGFIHVFLNSFMIIHKHFYL